jgi:hypothetical protein
MEPGNRTVAYRCYASLQVAVVSHGYPDKSDIEAFRQQFTMGLGYCPETLA